MSRFRVWLSRPPVQDAVVVSALVVGASLLFEAAGGNGALFCGGMGAIAWMTLRLKQRQRMRP